MGARRSCSSTAGAVVMACYGTFALLAALGIQNDEGGPSVFTTSIIVGALLVLLGAVVLAFGRRYTLVGGLLVAGPLVPIISISLAWGYWGYVIVVGIMIGLPPLLVGLYLLLEPILQPVGRRPPPRASRR